MSSKGKDKGKGQGNRPAQRNGKDKGASKRLKGAGRSREQLQQAALGTYSDVSDARESRSHDKFGDVENYEYETPDELDDDEIDSDDAFDDDDYAKYGDVGKVKARSKKQPTAKDSKKRKRSGVEEDPDANSEQEMEDDTGDDYIDIADLLTSSRPAIGKMFKKADLSEDEDDDAHADEYSDVDNDNGDLGEAAHSNLLSAIGKLDQRPQRIRDRSEGGQESEFAVHNSHTHLSLEDMMAPLSSSSVAGEVNVNKLRKEVDTLKGLAGKKRDPKNTLLPAAPSRPATERLSRAAAYEETSRDISKWVPVVKQNREAEHLSFPLNEAPPETLSSTSIAVKFKPETKFELEMQEALGSASGIVGLESAITDVERSALGKMSKTDAAERVAQLRHMRTLLSFYELKCKRLKKIKSKKFHRVLKKANQKKELSIDELKELDPELARVESEKLERSRAEARMKLRHSNTGKWAKRMSQRDNLDAETRKALQEQTSLGKSLLEKHGLSEDDEDDEDEDDDGSAGSGPDGEDAEDKHANADGDEDINTSDEDDEVNNLAKTMDIVVPAKGLFGLKFMQRAMQKKRAEAQSLLAELNSQLQAEDEQSQQQQQQQQQTGRRSFGNTASSAHASKHAGQDGGEDDDVEREVDEDDQTDTVPKHSAIRTSGAITIQTAPKTVQAPFHVDNFAAPSVASKKKPASKKRKADVSVEVVEADVSAPVEARVMGDNDTNPWLSAITNQDGTGRAAVKSGTSSASKTISSRAQTRMNKIAEDTGRKFNGKQQAVGRKGEDVDVDLNVVVVEAAPQQSLLGSAARALVPRPARASAANGNAGGNDSDSGSDVDESETGLTSTKNQRRLIAAAFAGDNVVHEFDEEKQEIVDEDTPKDKDLTLAGWGVWGGAGVKNPFKKQRIIVKARPSAPRKDKNLKHVIINEKMDKKSLKFAVKKLPHPYTSLEQYEQAMRNPIGPEWNSRQHFKDSIAPKITTKAGTVIKPLTITKDVVKRKKEIMSGKVTPVPENRS